jgi:predicted permease
MLSRAATRQKEIAVRQAIGATRGRLIRQLLTESLVLAGLGGVSGLAVAAACHRLFSSWGFATWNSERPAVDWSVLLFGFAITMLTGFVFGVVPALRSSHVDAMPVIRDGGMQFGRSRRTLGRPLLVFQIAMSLVLLIAAGLFLRTLQNLQAVQLGFDPSEIVLFTVDPELLQYDPSRNAALNEQIIDKVTTIPGVRSVSYSGFALFSGDSTLDGVVIPGRDTSSESIHILSVHPAFFETMKIPLKLGQGFTSLPAQGEPRPTIVNETFAKKFFPAVNPVGQRLGRNSEVEIIGVVGDAIYTGLRDAVPPMRYNRFRTPPTGTRTFEVRTDLSPETMLPEIRDAIRSIDPHLPLLNVSTQAELVRARFESERNFAFASTVFGGLALVISMIGLFGMMSYAVTRRTKEIGIRMALGAERRSVLGSVIGEVLILVGIGIVVGVVSGVAFAHFIASLLFGISPYDLPTIATAILLLIAVAVIAGYLPARQASRVDPLVALRHD